MILSKRGKKPRPLPDGSGGAGPKNADPVGPQQLYEQVAPRCYALALALTQDQACAEAVVQEAFQAACRHQERIDGGTAGQVLLWTHHRAVDLIRRGDAARRSVSDCPRYLAELIGSSRSRHGQDSVPERAGPVRAALGALSDPQRQVVALAFLGGYSQTEIADTLCVAPGTVKAWMLQAMRRLRADLSEQSQFRAKAPKRWMRGLDEDRHGGTGSGAGGG